MDDAENTEQLPVDDSETGAEGNQEGTGESDNGADLAGDDAAGTESGTSASAGSDTASPGGQIESGYVVLYKRDGTELGRFELDGEQAIQAIQVSESVTLDSSAVTYEQIMDAFVPLNTLVTVQLVLVAAVFGAVCVRTLMRSFEWNS